MCTGIDLLFVAFREKKTVYLCACVRIEIIQRVLADRETFNPNTSGIC